MAKLLLNQTHQADLTSWETSAQDSLSDFPIQNLPYGVFKKSENADSSQIGVAIGNKILPLKECLRHNLLEGLTLGLRTAIGSETLNALMAMNIEHWSQLRLAISQLLRSENSQAERILSDKLLNQNQVKMCLPVKIGDYTDFYASIHHATNVGKLFRPDSPLLPNYKHIPIGYHGRASSIVLSGTEIRRPRGQIKAPDSESPAFGPSQQLDFESELGIFIGTGNELGEPIAIAEAYKYIFGFCLLNDWSARDIQAWEYQPLGPFLGKSFASTISPWVVTAEALLPARVAAASRDAQEPMPLKYLMDKDDQEQGAYDIQIINSLNWGENSEHHRQEISRCSTRHLYWTPAQMIAHHTSNGCNLRPGDLLGSGTVSFSTRDTYGCFLEITKRGAEPFKLSDGGQRIFLQDGDSLVMRAHAKGSGDVHIGFGESMGSITSST